MVLDGGKLYQKTAKEYHKSQYKHHVCISPTAGFLLNGCIDYQICVKIDRKNNLGCSKIVMLEYILCIYCYAFKQVVIGLSFQQGRDLSTLVEDKDDFVKLLRWQYFPYIIDAMERLSVCFAWQYDGYGLSRSKNTQVLLPVQVADNDFE